MLVEIALWDRGLQEARLGGIASLVDSSGWDVPAGEAALPACAGCSQHTQVAKSLLAVDTKLVVLCLTFSPTVSCQKPPARPCHDWGSCWSPGLGAVLWKDAVSHWWVQHARRSSVSLGWSSACSLVFAAGVS